MQELHTQPISDEAAAEVEERLERHIHSNSTLDSLILSRLDDDGEPIPREPEQEFKDFVSARPYRQETKERHGTDAADVVKKFSYYDEQMRRNAPMAGEELAGDYYAASNVAKIAHVGEKQRAELSQGEKTDKGDKQDDVFPGVKLDRILDHAFDETAAQAADRAELEAAREQFAALKAKNPHLTWTQFFKDTVNLDRALLVDPSFAYRTVASTGYPVTGLQTEMAQLQVAENQQTNALESLLSDMVSRGELLSLDRYAPAMAQLWERPDFVKTGDTRQDLRRANRIVELLELDHLQNLERQNAVEKSRRAAPVKNLGWHADRAQRQLGFKH